MFVWYTWQRYYFYSCKVFVWYLKTVFKGFDYLQGKTMRVQFLVVCLFVVNQVALKSAQEISGDILASELDKVAVSMGYSFLQVQWQMKHLISIITENMVFANVSCGNKKYFKMLRLKFLISCFNR